MFFSFCKYGFLAFFTPRLQENHIKVATPRAPAGAGGRFFEKKLRKKLFIRLLYEV